MGRPSSKQCQAHSILDLIAFAYVHVGVAPPSKLVAQSTRGMATTQTLFRGAPLEDVCTAAGCTS